MTYLEEYLKENNCTEEDFYIHQEDYDGFCPRDIGIDSGCPSDIGNCRDCWKREIVEIIEDIE